MDFIARGARSRHPNVAIIGRGISRLSTASLISKRHDVTAFEAADGIGTYSNTVTFAADSGEVARTFGNGEHVSGELTRYR